ncbi:MAG: D-Ala-D-Ala carboxypeptidase family metallohydrolase [Oscillatoria sp. PMC 1068.18]|nr:D-Ala-D-Ala carboxypeptidase family metallohydrolase [Oscillatoria sp. PMC 1076.18]MEC4990115.1 D-Ala-D-Ala carboxypeptidase family metallohydrolase [Oscillatoria sp. PMC 1068.18]
MAKLTLIQRNYYYLLEAERSGIHQPILAALYAVSAAPSLGDGETGLGIFPVNQIFSEELETFPKQVQYAANTIRALTESLINLGWSGEDLWNAEKGCYSDKFVETVADGYIPTAKEKSAARLESTDFEKLLSAYLVAREVDDDAAQLPQNLADLETALWELVKRVPDNYLGWTHQRDALVEAVRLWRKLDTPESAIAALAVEANVLPESLTESELDLLLKEDVQRIAANYEGYPHQREALLRLTQLWRQLGSRDLAIASLENNSSPTPSLASIDPALIAFVRQVPQNYAGKGQQRNALTEAFRVWQQLGDRAEVLEVLGIEATILTANPGDQESLVDLATQLDRELLTFVQFIPRAYVEIDFQREALLRLVQLWRGLKTRSQTIASLSEDLKRLARERPQAENRFSPRSIPPRPSSWTPENIQLFAPIIPDGAFTWAEATAGGVFLPGDLATVEAIVRIATLAQRVRDRLGFPLTIASWYRPPDVNQALGGAKASRHLVGDGIDFVCENLTGNQIYWALDPWFPGGLGRYTQFPYLCHIDARGYQVRWQH